MAQGADARVAIARESAFGTRATPTKFLPLTAEDLGYTYNRYRSPAIGLGRWAGPSIITTQVGSGSISGDVTSTGMGLLLDSLHGNTVTPTQIAATPAYEQLHVLSTAPSKSLTVQVQTPPVTSNTLLPHDMVGVMFGGATFSWSPAGVLAFSMPAVYRELKLDQSLVSYVAPAAYDLFSFKGGSVTVGGVAEGNIIGDGSVEFGMALRDDAFVLGGNGMIAKPVETDKPTATISFTADFVDNANIQRVIDNTIADIVVKFEGAVISGANKYALEITVPDCTFNTQRPTVGGAGPLSLTVSAQASSSTGDAPQIRYVSTDVTL